MWLPGPATIIVLITAAALFCSGLWVLSSLRLGDGASGGRRRCTNPACGFENRADARYCAECGVRLDEPAART